MLLLSVQGATAKMLVVTAENVYTTGASLLYFARIPYLPVQGQVIPSWFRTTTLCERYDLVGTYQGPRDIMFVVYKTKTGSYILSFRGTYSRSLTNIMTDLSAWPVECALGTNSTTGCGKVHKGFQDAYLGVAQQVVKSLKGAKRIAITGHSLGGALAIMASVDLAEKV